MVGAGKCRSRHRSLLLSSGSSDAQCTKNLSPGVRLNMPHNLHATVEEELLEGSV